MRKRRNKRNCSSAARTKKTDWERSNVVHLRLKRKASKEWLDAYRQNDNKGMQKSWIKSMYHYDVWSKQNRFQRKLTAQEKKNCYDYVVSSAESFEN